MKFLENWTIDIKKIPNYKELKKPLTEDVDINILELCLEKVNSVEQIKIKKVISNMKKNVLITSLYQANGLGRFYLKNDTGLLTLKRAVKNTNYKYKNWIDIDQVKGHPTIIYELCKKNNYNIPIIQQYIENFDGIVADMIDFYCEEDKKQLTKKEIKLLFNITIYGGGISNWFNDMEEKGFVLKTKETFGFYDDFKLDLDKLQGVIQSHNKELYNQLFIPTKSYYENDNRFISYYFQIIENEINYQALLFLKQNGLITNEYSWGYDGITFPTCEFDIDELNAFVRNKTGFTEVRYIIKDFDECFDDVIEARNSMVILTEKEKLEQQKQLEKQKKEQKKREIEQQKQFERDQREEKKKLEREERELKEQLKQDAKDKEELMEQSNEEKFLIMSKEFEKEHLKIVNRASFIKHTPSEFIVLSESQLITAYKHMWYGIKDNTRLNFIQRWLINNDSQRRKIDIGCYPDKTKCPPDIFNTWTPFAMELVLQYEWKQNELDIILKHIHILCGNDIPTSNHFILWLAQMIQHPEVKTCCPFLISEKGAGKGTLMDLISSVVGIKKYKETTNPSRDVWGAFNEDMGGGYFVCLDELTKKELMMCESRFKGLITNPVLTINGKGQRPYDIVSYHRFIVCCNGGDFIPDRRCWIIRSSDEKIPDKQYFTNLKKIIKDVNVVKTFYEYLMSIEGTENFNELPIPQNEYQTDLKEANKSYVEMFLRDFVIENMNETEITLLGSKICSKFCSWRDKNKITNFEMNAIKMALRIKQLNINGITKGPPTNKGNQSIFNIPILKKHFNIKDLVEIEEKEDDES
jgi:hypothetical protein